ncbi:MAG: hypothetical protein A4E57_03467 [Syntrophorhabdaceae bacterium PtaU1.Bin034]|nr:MAG: hypothetical protein A4E57_03467 [Syntrophorhabdaceae bacterium PtaU1.Bin034]
MDYYRSVKEELERIAAGWMQEPVSVVSARTLSSKEAIGTPERTDFPLQKGKEFMIEAVFREARGQAFTDMPGNFQGSLKDVVGLELRDNFERAIFIAAFNAVMRHSGTVTGTVHCRDKQPKLCAEQLPGFVRKHFANPKIAFIGYQPAMIEELSHSFQLRVVDLDEGNIGQERFGIRVEGPEKTEEVLLWGDMVMATGSTCVNGSITDFLIKKPVVFFGVTVAGLAVLEGYRRYCPFGQ